MFFLAIQAARAFRSRRYASSVARLRPFSIVIHCRYSSRASSNVIEKTSKESVQRDGRRRVDREGAAQDRLNLVLRVPVDSGARLFGARGLAFHFLEFTRFVHPHDLGRPAR